MALQISSNVFVCFGADREAEIDLSMAEEHGLQSSISFDKFHLLRHEIKAHNHRRNSSAAASLWYAVLCSSWEIIHLTPRRNRRRQRTQMCKFACDIDLTGVLSMFQRAPAVFPGLMNGCMQFLRLGFDGYKKIMSNLLMVARRLRLGIEETGERSMHTQE